MPKISIIIPCYNLGEYLDEAVNSILAQTYQDFEIIIVNDGSTDDFTNTLLVNYNKPKTKVLTTKNQGLPSARNTGIDVSKGEYICCLDADDKYHPQFLEKTIDILESDNQSKIGFVTTWLQMFEEINMLWSPDSCNPFLLATENIVHVASLFRKECWEKVGGYATNLTGYQDWNFWISIAARGYEWFLIKEPLFLYRVRKNSMVTGSNQKRLLLYSQIVENNKEFYIKNIKDILMEYQKKSTELLQSLEGTQERLNKTDEELNKTKIKLFETLHYIDRIKSSRIYQLSLILKNATKSWKGFLVFPFKLGWLLLPINTKKFVKHIFKFTSQKRL